MVLRVNPFEKKIEDERKRLVPLSFKTIMIVKQECRVEITPLSLYYLIALWSYDNFSKMKTVFDSWIEQFPIETNTI